jgi:hypothetical protein
LPFFWGARVVFIRLPAPLIIYRALFSKT